MVILVLNCGSSSIKYQVIDMEAASSTLLAKGIVERIGLPEGDLIHKPVGKQPFELHRPIPDHTTGIKLVLDALTNPEHGVIRSLDEVKAVGHRVAHGGEFFPESCIVTEEVKSKIRSLFEIAPLHNPANLESANVFFKSVTHLCGGELAAMVMGTKVPCVLTSRGDTSKTKLYSIALACLAVKQ